MLSDIPGVTYLSAVTHLALSEDTACDGVVPVGKYFVSVCTLDRSRNKIVTLIPMTLSVVVPVRFS